MRCQWCGLIAYNRLVVTICKNSYSHTPARRAAGTFAAGDTVIETS
jgi:hypothetical protein